MEMMGDNPKPLKRFKNLKLKNMPDSFNKIWIYAIDNKRKESFYNT